MLNAETKRRINACRDILVGKVTDPKAQVEQITIALMYKFMNDLDHEVRDLGGKASFFAGEFATYSWDRITDTRLGGEERLRLYAEGIEAVVKNPSVPELFRQIFRNAYLPYRDPETFNLFSREISGFRYEHSEDLGDAFEYVMSVMQSQGNAGQFRTPRHIIDFMVDVVKPQPGERVLDPACGTAGFLISAFKYIAKHNPQLTPAQIEDLHLDFEGLDIDPGMVRLSRVNLYLHQFADPHVLEYDTLTSDDRWGQRYDVILANPPFMTPKGGIRPHRKFSLESNRSEVLFVDYIAEHLMITGRAAVIVPEGIIFQSGKAYQQLRRLLVENSLWAVASLPAGVFNPYSGVKTSILFLDRGLAAKQGSVLFVQVKADGHDLGAQRRAIAANDLPSAMSLLDDAHGRLTRGEVPADFRDSLAEHALAHLFVPRAVLLAGDVNLSGERYRVAKAVGAQKWPRVKLGEVCETLAPPHKIQTQDYKDDGTYPIIDQSQVEIAGWTNDAAALVHPEKPFVIFGDHTCCVKLVRKPFAQGADGIKILKTREDVLPEYLYFTLLARPILSDGYKRHFSVLKEYELPLPPLSVQQEVVAEVTRYQAVIDGARQVVASWKPSFTVDPEWPVVKLGEVCDLVTDGDHQPPPKSPEGVPFVTISNIDASGHIDFGDTYFVPQEYFDSIKEEKRPRMGDVLYTVTGSYGIPVLVDFEKIFCFQRHIALVRPSNCLFAPYVFWLLFSEVGRDQADKVATGVAQKTVTLGALRQFDIPLPSLALQQSIVAQIEEERAIVEANKSLMARMQTRIDEAMERVWR